MNRQLRGLFTISSASALAVGLAQPANAQIPSAQTPSAQTAAPAATSPSVAAEHVTEAPPEVAANPQALGDIIVTAQKRSQSIQRVPASIQVQTGETIAAYQQTNLRNIAVNIPNLVLTQSPSGSISANIRGFGTPTANAGFEQTVALFVDGVYSPRPQSYSGAVFDVERIEVVKGTQGTLFGKNAEVGGISLITRSPGSSFGGTIDAGYDFRTNGARAEGGVDLPVSDRLRFRIAGLYDDQDEGYILNRATGKQQPTTQEYGGRAKMLWKITDALSINAKAEFSRFDRDGSTLFGTGGPLFAGISDKNAVKNASSTQIPENDGQDYMKRRSDVESVGFVWNVADHVVTSISSWQTLKFNTAADFDQTTGPIDFVNAFNENFSQFTQELRIASNEAKRFSYIAGVFYLSQNLLNGLNTRFAAAPATQVLTYDDHVYSAFAQGAYKATDRLSLTVGGRFTHEKKAGALDVTKRAGRAVTRGTARDDSFDWSLIAEYEVVGDTRLYATVSRGNKSQGFLNSVPGAALVPAAVFIDGERATNYEVGVKSRFLDGRGRGSIAVYYLDVKGFQGAEFNPALGSFVVSNVDARAQGIEANVQLRPIPQLTLDASAAYNEANVRATGNQLISAPKFNGTLGANYTTPLTTGTELQLGSQFTYQTKFPHQFDLNPLNFTPSHENLDARIGVRLTKQAITVSLVGKNLTNARYTEFAFGNPAAPGQSFDHQINRPRSIAITMNATF